MEYLLITNNPLMVQEQEDTIFVEGSSFDVLLKTRDYIHKGHYLLTSPIGASIRMLLSSAKTVIVSKNPCSMREYDAGQIELALEKYQNITALRGEDIVNTKDYRCIDRELTLAAIKEILG